MRKIVVIYKIIILVKNTVTKLKYNLKANNMKNANLESVSDNLSKLKISKRVIDNINEKKKISLEKSIEELKIKKNAIIIQLNNNQKEIDNLKITIVSLDDNSTIKVELDDEELYLNMFKIQKEQMKRIRMQIQ